MSARLLSSILVALLFLGGCGETAGDREPSAWEVGPQHQEPIWQGLYEVDVEIDRDECRSPSLRDLVDVSDEWPPNTDAVQRGPPITEEDAYELDAVVLRTGESVGVAAGLNPDGTLSSPAPHRQVRTFEEPKRCNSRERGEPLRRTRISVWPREGHRFRVRLRTEWRGYDSKCVDRETALKENRWYPENTPCTEQVTFTLRLVSRCKPWQRCTMSDEMLTKADDSPPFALEPFKCIPRPENQIKGEPVDPSRCSVSAD